MQQRKHWWQILLQEPFIWLFYFFFQPTKFKRDIEAEGIMNRLMTMLRLAFPMFLCCFPIVLATRIVLNLLYPGFYVVSLSTSIPRFLYGTTWGTALGIVGGIAGIIIIGTTSNIAL